MRFSVCARVLLGLSTLSRGVIGVTLPRDDAPQLWAGEHPSKSDLEDVFGYFYSNVLAVAYGMVQINPLWIESNIMAPNIHSASAATFKVYDVNLKPHKADISIAEAKGKTPWWFDGWARAIGNAVNVDPTYTYLHEDAPGMELKDAMRLMTGHESVEIETVQTGMEENELWDILQHYKTAPIVVQVNFTDVGGPLGNVFILSFNAVDELYTQDNVRRAKIWNSHDHLRDVSVADLAKNVRQLVHTKNFGGYKGKHCPRS